jgi:hypothetical protein
MLQALSRELVRANLRLQRFVFGFGPWTEFSKPLMREMVVSEGRDPLQTVIIAGIG